MRLLRDDSGASAAEYALILLAFGAPVALAAVALGNPIRNASYIRNFGPDGAVHRCTANCQYDYMDYCAAVSHLNDPAPPVFSPAITGTCVNGIPVS